MEPTGVAVLGFIALLIVLAVVFTYPKWNDWKKDIKTQMALQKSHRISPPRKRPYLNSRPDYTWEDPCPPGGEEEPARIHASGRSAKRCANPACQKPLGHNRLNIHLTRSKDGWTTADSKKQYCCWDCVPPEVQEDISLSLTEAENTTRKAINGVEEMGREITRSMKELTSDLRRSSDEILGDLFDILKK